MSSHTQLAVVNLQAGMLRFSMWALQEMSSGSLTSSFPLQPQQREGKPHTKEGFKPLLASHLRMAHWPKQGTSPSWDSRRGERTSLLDEKSSDVTSLRSMGGMLHHIVTKSLPWEPQLPPTGRGMSTIIQALVRSQGKIILPVPQGKSSLFQASPCI